MDLYAVPEMTWPSTLPAIEPVGTKAAVLRFEERLPDLILNEMRLEGIDISESQLDKVLAGKAAPGLSPEDAQRAVAYARAVDQMLEWVKSGGFGLGLQGARQLNHGISAAEGVLEPGIIRGKGSVQGGGHVSGPGFRYSAPESGARLHEYLERHLARIYDFPNPVLRATAMAALFAYTQPFFDGNKRTGRLVMDYELLRYGFDGIIVPAEHEADYVAAVAKMYRGGDATAYVEFLVAFMR
jgi:Fic family protein